MDGTLAVAPPSTARAWFAVAARALGLLLLVAAGASALVTNALPAADFQALLHDVRAGKVRSVVIVDEGGDGATVRWSTGGFRQWSTAVDRTSPLVGGDGKQTVDVRATIVREARAAGHPIRIDSRSRAAVWTLNAWWPALGWLATAAWLLALAAMLANRRTRYANRWAWFWLFTQGVVGALFYLLLEPVPLRCRPGRELRPDWRMGGGVGFLTALLLAILIGLSSLGVEMAIGSDVRTSEGEMIVPVLTG
jgi:hypothetical protein